MKFNQVQQIPVELRSTFVHPQILTILATYKCTAACQNCCFSSNPYLTKRITLQEILVLPYLVG
jgi:hypothetical protein